MLKVKGLFSLFSTFVLLLYSFQSALAGTDHVVTSAELHHALVQSSQGRQASLDSIQRLFSRPEVARAVQSTVGSPKQIMEAVAALSDDELARLAEKARGIEQDFAAGALSNQELTYIIIALATAVLILIIIEAGE